MSKTADIPSLEEFSILKNKYQKALDEIGVLKHELAELKRMIFGSKSERFIPVSDDQLTLFNDIEPKEAPQEQEEIINYSRTKATKDKKQPIRGVLPSHLPRVEETIEPENLEKGAAKIGQEVTEILEYNPANLFVRRIIRPKYALKEQKGVVIGELPTLPLPKSNAGASILAYIIVSKMVDHLPFYRQRQIFKRFSLNVLISIFSGVKYSFEIFFKH